MKDKYLQYNITDFVQDDDFIHWAKTGSETDLVWMRWLEKHPAMRGKIMESRTIVRNLRFAETEVSQSVEDDIWQKISTATTQQVATRRRVRMNWIPYAAAASVALLLAFFFLNPNRHINKERVASASTEQIVLPDGSSIAINAESEIAYNSNTWDKERKISLKGEAFFEVEKGAPFIVETPQGNVRVLGTSFNVDSYDNSFEVTCFTGKVEISKNGQTMILTPGEGGKWIDDRFETIAFDPNDIKDWRNGVFEYNEAPLKVVFSELERQFDVTIEAPNDVLDRQYTGFFNNTQLDSALYLVTWPMRLQYKHAGNKVTIIPNGK